MPPIVDQRAFSNEKIQHNLQLCCKERRKHWKKVLESHCKKMKEINNGIRGDNVYQRVHQCTSCSFLFSFFVASSSFLSASLSFNCSSSANHHVSLFHIVADARFKYHLEKSINIIIIIDAHRAETTDRHLSSSRRTAVITSQQKHIRWRMRFASGLSRGSCETRGKRREEEWEKNQNASNCVHVMDICIKSVHVHIAYALEGHWPQKRFMNIYVC